jgi:hypothetical protein
MPTTLTRCQAVQIISAVLVSCLSSTVTAQVQGEPAQPELARESAAATSDKAVPREPWHLVRIPDPLARRATIATLESASAQLMDADCRKVLTDFADGNGRSLADRLSSVAVDIHVYLTMVTFIDDSRHTRCASGVMVFTAPGSRVVRVCAEELTRIYRQQPDYVVATIIHEILHTLGLGENPPSSSEITARVLARCGRKQAGDRVDHENPNGRAGATHDRSLRGNAHVCATCRRSLRAQGCKWRRDRALTQTRALHT